MSRSAIVVGAGIAGLAAVIALRQAGYAVTIVEDAPRLAPAGAAISLWGNAMAALDRLGAGAAIRRDAQPIAGLAVYGRDRRAILSPVALPTAEAFLPTRTLVQSSLLEALGDIDLRLGRRVTSIAQDDDGVTATLADGGELRADLAIVADGIWSPTATALIGNPPRHTGYGGVLGLSAPVDLPVPPGAAAEYWGDGERFGLFDLGGGRRYWFWMRDETAGGAGRAIGHGEVAASARGWPGDIAAAVAATPADALIRFAIHARPAPRRLGAGRIICVGDAAHAMEPNLGQGACQGIEDALALGEAARALPPDAMLAAFERARLARIRSVVTTSHRAGRAVHGTSAIERRLTRTALRAVPSAIAARAVRRYHSLPR